MERRGKGIDGAGLTHHACMEWHLTGEGHDGQQEDEYSLEQVYKNEMNTVKHSKVYSKMFYVPFPMYKRGKE